MKSCLAKTFPLSLLFSLIMLALSCAENKKDIAENSDQNTIQPKTLKPKITLSNEFKKYWYDGNAEITSYTLEQARYGELRQGNAVLIFVTEPFLPEIQVKADNSDPSNIPVLKLNSTKKYLTGIYPYSIMTSSFYPVHDNQHALKVSFSGQEWCGHVYAQLNNKEDFEIMSRSYFESEADQNMNLKKTPLEDEVWSKIRINPDALITGEIDMIPSFEYLRLTHKELRSYKAIASINVGEEIGTYSINYPELERTLKINFTNTFPHSIEGWTDSYKGGYGQEAKILTSKATKLKRLKTPYWKQNDNKDLYLRDSLGLSR